MWCKWQSAEESVVCPQLKEYGARAEEMIAFLYTCTDMCHHESIVDKLTEEL